MILYVDSSALVKRYVQEKGRRSLEQRLGSSDRLFSSAITFAEVHATLAAKRRGGGMDEQELLRVQNDFERDWLQFEEIAVRQETLSVVRDLVIRVPLRGMDAIHLAAALWLARRPALKPELISTDDRLLSAAEKFGLPVFNPEQAEKE